MVNESLLPAAPTRCSKPANATPPTLPLPAPSIVQLESVAGPLSVSLPAPPSTVNEMPAVASDESISNESLPSPPATVTRVTVESAVDCAVPSIVTTTLEPDTDTPIVCAAPELALIVSGAGGGARPLPVFVTGSGRLLPAPPGVLLVFRRARGRRRRVVAAVLRAAATGSAATVRVVRVARRSRTCCCRCRRSCSRCLLPGVPLPVPSFVPVSDASFASPVELVTVCSLRSACTGCAVSACAAGVVGVAGSAGTPRSSGVGAAAGVVSGATGCPESLGGAAGADVAGSVSGVPTLSLTTGTFANGSFAFFVAVGAAATWVCESVTTGTVRRATLCVGCVRAGCAAGVRGFGAAVAAAGSGASGCSFGTRSSGTPMLGYAMFGNAMRGALTAGCRKTAATGAAYITASTRCRCSPTSTSHHANACDQPKGFPQRLRRSRSSRSPFPELRIPLLHDPPLADRFDVDTFDDPVNRPTGPFTLRQSFVTEACAGGVAAHFAHGSPLSRARVRARCTARSPRSARVARQSTAQCVTTRRSESQRGDVVALRGPKLGRERGPPVRRISRNARICADQSVQNLPVATAAGASAGRSRCVPRTRRSHRPA